jgi:RNA polymerase sigma-70 factor (sigma-E family)
MMPIQELVQIKERHLTSARDDAFREFFAAEAEPLRRFATFLTGDAHQAADLAQEALVRTYRHWNRIRGDEAAPYARRILVNLVRSEHRKVLVRRKHDRATDHPTISHSERVDEWLRISKALEVLPPMRRAAVVLRFYEDMSEAEIARTLDRPAGTIKSDIHRGLARLRRELEGPGGEDS